MAKMFVSEDEEKDSAVEYSVCVYRAKRTKKQRTVNYSALQKEYLHSMCD